MDYSCQDIPMRLDIRYQPLNFDIYLSQVIEVPRTSLQEQPYDFHSENEALERVDQIIERTQRENKDLNLILDTNSTKSQIPSEPTSDCNNISDTDAINQNLVNNVLVAPPSCPTETPLTPIKSTVIPTSSSDGSSATATNSQEQQQKQSEAPLFNPRDFEDIHYKFDPFDHAELQTIDERRELDMIFQAASFANQSNK